MDIGFHYSTVLKLARSLGFREPLATLFAEVSQFVDDCRDVHTIKTPRGMYRGIRTQTLNPFSPEEVRRSVYLPFHFLPGNAEKAAERKDGKTHRLCVTPGSRLCDTVFAAAAESKNPFRIGIALHACADTWAHQNFVGGLDPFNGTGSWTPNIGHADVGTCPDTAGLVWEDPRLVESRIYNYDRFEAAEKWLADRLTGVERDLECPGPVTPAHGWFRESAECVPRLVHNGNRSRVIQDFKSKPGFESSLWYKFQEAAKEHAKLVLA